MKYEIGRTAEEMGKIMEEAQNMLDDGKDEGNIAQKGFLEAVAQTLSWILEKGDDPLMDSRE